MWKDPNGLILFIILLRKRKSRLSLMKHFVLFLFDVWFRLLR